MKRYFGTNVEDAFYSSAALFGLIGFAIGYWVGVWHHG